MGCCSGKDSGPAAKPAPSTLVQAVPKKLPEPVEQPSPVPQPPTEPPQPPTEPPQPSPQEPLAEEPTVEPQQDDLATGVPSLDAKFVEFASFGKGSNEQDSNVIMDGKQFSKLCRDCKLVDKKFQMVDVDIVFAKVKPKGQRTIDFDAFNTNAVAEIAKKRGCTEDDVRVLIAGGAARRRATKAGDVALASAEASCGVYARGGPDSASTNPVSHATRDWGNGGSSRSLTKRSSGGGARTRRSGGDDSKVL